MSAQDKLPSLPKLRFVPVHEFQLTKSYKFQAANKTRQSQKKPLKPLYSQQISKTERQLKDTQNTQLSSLRDASMDKSLLYLVEPGDSYLQSHPNYQQEYQIKKFKVNRKKWDQIRKNKMESQQREEARIQQEALLFQQAQTSIYKKILNRLNAPKTQNKNQPYYTTKEGNALSQLDLYLFSFQNATKSKTEQKQERYNNQKQGIKMDLKSVKHKIRS